MNQLDVITGQYHKTILELQTRIVQAALELNAAQERIVELEKVSKAQDDVIEALKKSADVGKDILDAVAGKPHLEAVPKDGAA